VVVDIETPPLCFGTKKGWGVYKNLGSNLLVGVMGMLEQKRQEKLEKVTEAQRKIYIVIEEYWKKYGFGPSLDDIMYLTGEKSRNNVSRKMWRLVELGLCKGVRRRARSIRPAYMRVRELV
jgi:sulfur relay (sulfurtransferase) DsrC/TusE family protein